MRIYEEKDLVRVAKRDNNTKRPYLLVDPLQGKHIPVSPAESLELFSCMGEMLSETCRGERLIVIGFAETATAIGAAAAIFCPEVKFYLHTTREAVEQEGEVLYFSEVHSHATEQKLSAARLDEVIGNADRIVFAEDEVTTGNTIMNLIRCLRERYPENSLKFGVISILNGMNEEQKARFEREEITIMYMKKLISADYERLLEAYSYEAENIIGNCRTSDMTCKGKSFSGKQDPRLGVKPEEYQEACGELADSCIQWMMDEGEKLAGKRILVLGTEEFMYPALHTAGKLEQECGCQSVRFHATTRSPILPSPEEEYPLHSRAELKSLYDGERTTFIYNLEEYDAVLIISDAEEVSQEGLLSLKEALAQAGNKSVYIAEWSE